MKIAIGSDKSGFAVKEAVKAYLAGTDIAFDDLGTTDLNEVHPYYQVASEVAPLVQEGKYDFAVLICGTGARVCTPQKWHVPSTMPAFYAWEAGLSGRSSLKKK